MTHPSACHHQNARALSIQAAAQSARHHRFSAARLRTQPEKYYKVLYLNDGQDAPAIKLAETLAALIAHHEIEPIIVVAIHATRDRLHEYGTAGIPNARGLGKKARKYSFFILDEVLPYINRRYRTLPGAVNTAMMGFSLGGLMAFDLAWNHPDVFGAVGRVLRLRCGGAPMRPTCTPGRNRASCIAACAIPKSPGYLRLWFQAGTDDEQDDRDNNGVIDAIQDTTELMDELARKGFRRGIDMVYTQVEGGEHNQATWGFILPYFLRWTFPDAALRAAASARWPRLYFSADERPRGFSSARQDPPAPCAQRAKHAPAACRGEEIQNHQTPIEIVSAA